eukprot:PhM_4_TR14270/c2_g1_i2/m.4932
MSFRPLTEIVSEFAGVALPDDNVAALQVLARALKHVKSEAEHKRLMDAIHATQATISAKAATNSPEESLTEHFRKEEARRTDPWRIVSETCAARAKNITRTHNIESCRRLFQNQAKAKALTPFLSIVMSGVLMMAVFVL